MSGKPKKPYDKSVYRSFVMVLQFGLNMLVPICMMSALGIFLDKRLGTSWIMILLFFIGAIAGAQNVYRMARQVYGSEKPDRGSRGISGQSRRKTAAEREGEKKEQKDVSQDK